MEGVGKFRSQRREARSYRKEVREEGGEQVGVRDDEEKRENAKRFLLISRTKGNGLFCSKFCSPREPTLPKVL